MKVIINADDFGLTKGVVDGIIEAHKNGVVDSTTMMMNGCSVPYAVEQAKLHPDLKVGIHLVLTWGRPLLKEGVSSLINKEGEFRLNSAFSGKEPPDKNEVYNEWKQQIEAFIETGLKLHHIDSHHHIHSWDEVKDAAITLAKEYNVPLRYADSLSEHQEILLSDTLYTDFYGETIYNDLFDAVKVTEAGIVEVMTHPGCVDEQLKQNSSYLEFREKELEILTRIQRPEWAEKY
ncbi:chitin disaccharide deacetylase [Corticicoccus populi]|uniref:Chitin disaccharide deacetylase n=1 Tax=Corticicoccus populi TaxID=1812821 RepID=A0ABW5WVU6_9STAP